MTIPGDYRHGGMAAWQARGFRSPCHLVFVTKYRRDVLDADMLRCCENAMRKVCGDFGAELREFNAEDDHVHLLVAYPPKVAVSPLVNSLKGVSARRRRRVADGGQTSVPWRLSRSVID
jgi:REP element-mobilizing transposase RayT